MFTVAVQTTTGCLTGVLKAIKEMPTGERERLFMTLEERPSLMAQYALIPVETLERLLDSHHVATQVAVEIGRKFLPDANQAARYQRGPKAKHEKLRKRHEAIDKAVEAGVKSDEELYNFMKEHRPELIQMGKKKKTFIDPSSMMQTYRKHRRGHTIRYGLRRGGPAGHPLF